MSITCTYVLLSTVLTVRIARASFMAGATSDNVKIDGEICARNQRQYSSLTYQAKTGLYIRIVVHTLS